MIISVVVAVSENNVIGKDKKLPWHLPADLKYFKKLTMNHHIVMGRTTHESIGRPLPGRTNIILTRQENYQAEGCIVVSNLSSAFATAEEAGDSECFVIGGSEIFEQSIPLADKIYLTRIFQTFDGDTFFPHPDERLWTLVSQKKHAPDEKNKYHYAFQVFERLKK